MNKFFYISLLLGLITYLIVLAYIYLFQRNLLYHPSVNGYQGDEINFDYEEVFIKNNEGRKKETKFNIEFASIKTRKLS